jgi:hypothetical protein
MSHLVMENDVITTRVGDARAWHKLDTQADFSAMRISQIIDAFGLDHTMDIDPLARFSTGQSIPNLYGVFSSKTGECVNQVSERFTVVQPAEFFKWAYNVCGELQAPIVSGGTLKNTRHAFICAELPASEIDLGHGDTLKKFLFFGISWDGSYPIVCMLNDIRTVCWNTTPSLEAATRKDANQLFYQKRHGLLNGVATRQTVEAFRACQTDGRAKSQAVLQKLVETKYDLSRPTDVSRFASIMADGKAVIDRILAVDSFDRGASLLDKCLTATIDQQAWNRVATSGLSNAANRIVVESIHGLGADLSTARGTLWGMLNGYTYWADHVSGRDDANRTEDVVFGGFSQEKQNAMLLLSAIANTPAAIAG